MAVTTGAVYYIEAQSVLSS